MNHIKKLQKKRWRGFSDAFSVTLLMTVSTYYLLFSVTDIKDGIL